MQIEFGDLITEEVKEVVDWLERVARPAVQSTIKDAADFKIKLKLWLSAQRLELLRNKSHWQLEERDCGLPKLKKRFEWSSPSYHDVFLEETTLKFNGKKVKAMYDCLAFLYLISTDLKWFRIYKKVHAADTAKSGGLATYTADATDLMDATSLSTVHSKCAYALKTDRVYIGMSARSGDERYKEHQETPISLKVASERAKVDWKEWTTAAIYIPAKDVALDMPDAFLYYVEHSGMVVTRSVELGLNTNAFDKNSYRRITTRQLEFVVEHSLDMLCPKQSDGMRVKFGGETLDKGFFHRHSNKFSKILLSANQMHFIMTGRCWQWHVRRLLDKHGVDEHIWFGRYSGGRVGEEFEGWDAGRKRDKARKPNNLRRERNPARRHRDTEEIASDEPAASDEDDDDETSAADDQPYFNHGADRPREIRNEGMDWMANFSVGRKK
ncbi:hypothetical protein JCM8115_000150 [Rhodotorula mucilaginosa]